MSTQSEILYAQAQQIIPGGVNSPVRAFKGVTGTPIFIKRGHGAYLVDVDDKQYIDYIGSWGPLVLGHNHPEVIAAVELAIQQGLSFGAPTEIEISLAKKVCELVPSIEQLRMVNSGTEATMTAIRLARGYTSRDKLIKFDGCYHGHCDSLLVNAGSGALTWGVPSSPGVPNAIAEQTLTATYNDLDSVTALFENYPNQIAAVIVEPVAGNMNCVPPQPGFLQGLRELCTQHKSILIFDEVMTGFRVALGGAQALYQITPDLTTLGKVIGGGMPVGALGGRREIMEYLAPVGPIYQAGTLSGNPIAMAAGLATLNVISRENIFHKLTATTKALTDGLTRMAKTWRIPVTTTAVGGMFGLFFIDGEAPRNSTEVKNCDIKSFQQFFHGMLSAGIYLAPSAFEAGFVSTAHHQEEIELTLAAAEQTFATLKEKTLS